MGGGEEGVWSDTSGYSRRPLGVSPSSSGSLEKFSQTSSSGSVELSDEENEEDNLYYKK